MPDKEIEALKKQVAAEIKLLARKTEKHCKEAKCLREEEVELAKNDAPTDDDKKRQVDLRKALQGLEKAYSSEADSASDRISRLVKGAVPTDQKAVPEWQKGMEKWYRDQLQKEPGLDLGNGLRATGDISIKDKQANIYLNGKF